MEAYCMKCKEKREITAAEATFNRSGAPVTTGTCSVCGTKVYRTGNTPAHDHLERPVYVKPEPVRSGNLVIVESPAKAKTVGRFLGKGYTVKASVGHIRDLLKSQLSVDVENEFQPKYRVPNEKKPVVKELKALAKSHEMIYLATDPDREGEAISWHLAETLELEPTRTQRVTFHEITQDAISEAFGHAREIDYNLVNAQQARRVLDRLVGYSISPILWEKVRSRLSAGRVQSVALRLVVDRENEINEFVPVEYWSIHALFVPEHGKNSDAYTAKLAKIDGADLKISTHAEAAPLVSDILQTQFSITRIKKSERRRKPAAPFTTSTLQQEASRKLNFTAKRTMALAQRLYEGIDVGDGGQTGLITYMRTDSTNVSIQAKNEAKSYIKKVHGEDYLPPTPNEYRTKAKGAQEAHEAIRPTSVFRTPDSIKHKLDGATLKLYKLIWNRFLASQMASAVYDTVSVEIEGKRQQEYLFRANGSVIKFKGFLAVYEEEKTETIMRQEEEEEIVKIPASLEEGQNQDLKSVTPDQHFTQPPPRYSEASLVQALEADGIGRPSTYAPIISTIQDRGYVVKVEKRLEPTETGFLVNDLMMQYFPDIVDVKFTAGLEESLDEVADGHNNWVRMMSNFYGPFSREVETARKDMPESKAELEKIGRQCPDCGADLVIRYGRFGKFISCGAFPTCRYTEPLLEKIGVTCPKDRGDLVKRKTRKGKVFYGCQNYPNCDFNSWKQPIANPCQKCGGLLVVNNKREVGCTSCSETFLLVNILGEDQE